MRVAVVDYGMGNLHSVSKAVEHVAPNARVEVTSDPMRVSGADRVVFPGQGAMPDCMREMDSRGLRVFGPGPGLLGLPPGTAHHHQVIALAHQHAVLVLIPRPVQPVQVDVAEQR